MVPPKHTLPSLLIWRSDLSKVWTDTHRSPHRISTFNDLAQLQPIHNSASRIHVLIRTSIHKVNLPPLLSLATSYAGFFHHLDGWVTHSFLSQKSFQNSLYITVYVRIFHISTILDARDLQVRIQYGGPKGLIASISFAPGFSPGLSTMQS